MLCDCRACAAYPLAEKVREAKALLDAVHVGGLLEETGCAATQQAARALIEIARQRLADSTREADRLPAVSAKAQPGGPSVFK